MALTLRSKSRQISDTAQQAKARHTSIAANAVAVQARPDSTSCRMGLVTMEARPCASRHPQHLSTYKSMLPPAFAGLSSQHAMMMLWATMSITEYRMCAMPVKAANIQPQHAHDTILRRGASNLVASMIQTSAEGQATLLPAHLITSCTQLLQRQHGDCVCGIIDKGVCTSIVSS